MSFVGRAQHYAAPNVPKCETQVRVNQYQTNENHGTTNAWYAYPNVCVQQRNEEVHRKTRDTNRMRRARWQETNVGQAAKTGVKRNGMERGSGAANVWRPPQPNPNENAPVTSKRNRETRSEMSKRERGGSCVPQPKRTPKPVDSNVEREADAERVRVCNARDEAARGNWLEKRANANGVMSTTANAMRWQETVRAKSTSNVGASETGDVVGMSQNVWRWKTRVQAKANVRGRERVRVERKNECAMVVANATRAVVRPSVKTQCVRARTKECGRNR